MSIALLVMTDGRDDLLHRAMFSAGKLTGCITELWMHDDTGDDAYREDLKRKYNQWTHIGEGPRRGFSGAMQHAWQQMIYRSGANWIFHLEQDFVIERSVDLYTMSDILRAKPWLVQMALRRQAWSQSERSAGGIVEKNPDQFEDCQDGDVRWLAHRQFYTTNPSLYSRSLCEQGWPSGPESEGRFFHHLISDGIGNIAGDELRFGYWGARTDPPSVTHIGHHRKGFGY